MHHFLSRPDWLDEVNEALAKLGQVMKPLTFDTHFVLVENAWASGHEPEDVAAAIHAGTFTNIARDMVFAVGSL